MFGDKVYLKVLPKYGLGELFFAKKDKSTFFMMSRNFEGLNDKIYIIEAHPGANNKCHYSTLMNQNFSLIEDGEKILINNSTVELIKFYFKDDKNFIELAALSPDQPKVDYSKFENFFLKQEFLDEQKHGNTFVKQQKNAAEEILLSATDSKIEITFDTDEENLMLRGVLATQGVSNICKEDSDYAEEFQKVHKIVIGKTETHEPEFIFEGEEFRINLNSEYYNIADVTQHWLQENM